MTSQNVSPSSVRISQYLKFLVLKPTDTDDDSQMTQTVPATASQQPSPEALALLGIKVRDFAYENTLPAINPVPRVPRQVQPTPPARKRPQSDGDDTPLVTPTAEQPGAKRPRTLERKSTEPLQEPPVQARTLGRITLARVCSIIIPPPRRMLPPTPHTRFSASPPTSPLTPLLSHLASQDPQLVQTPSAFPFVVHVDDTSMIPASQIDSESQSASFHPTLYSRLTRSSLRCSPASNPQNTSSAPLSSPFLDLSSPNKELEADPRVRKRRNRGIANTIPSSPYQLRQRPIPSSHTSTLSRRPHQATSPSSNSLSRRTRLVR